MKHLPSFREQGMILLPVLILAASIAGVAGMAALARHGASSEARIRIEKARSLYLAQGGAAEALALIAGLALQNVENHFDVIPTVIDYDHGEAFFTIRDTAAMLNVNRASEDELFDVFRNAGLENPRKIAAIISDSRINGSNTPHWPLRTLDRLLLVPGMTPEIFFGSHAEFRTAENSRQAGGKAAPPLLNLLTIHGGADRNLDRSQNPPSFFASHTYHIIAMGRSGGVASMLWITARKELAHPAGVVILQRRVF